MGRTFVVNASPLILLARIDRLDLLTTLAQTILVPQRVLDEVAAGSDRDRALETVRSSSIAQIVQDRDLSETIRMWDLGAGESQVLAQAIARPGSEAILDDLAARRCARALGVSVLGTLGVVITCRHRGVIPAARPVIAALVNAGIRLAPSLIDAALHEVGETS